MKEKEDVIVIGAGGHSKVIVELLQRSADYELVGIIAKGQQQKNVLGCPIIGEDDALPKLLYDGVCHAFIAIGDNQRRQQLAMQLQTMGFNFINVISTDAYVSPTATLGVGVCVMPGAIVQTQTRIGDHSIINTGASVDHDGEVGAYAHIAPGATLAGQVVVGEGALLGAGSTVIPDMNIGRWATVGAGAVVVNSMSDQVTVKGVPAKQS